MTPEQRARKEIDCQLDLSGWLVQDFRAINISAGLGVAVREFPLQSGFADYLLYADGRAIGVVEAKPEGHALTGLHPAVLIPPAVKSLLADLQCLAGLADRLAAGKHRVAFSQLLDNLFRTVLLALHRESTCPIRASRLS